MKRSPTTGMAVVVIAAGAVMLGLSGLIGPAPAEAPQAPDAAPITVATAGLDRSIQQAQDRLTQYPNDDATWARLGSSYVEQARITADPSYYAKAQGALEKSLQLRPEGNGAALIGMGALANARHEFAAAKDWAIRAQALLPDTADVYAVLADALTQLGEADAATEAVQRMLDLRPSVASFSRASYDLELHGRPDEARAAMERALTDATSLDQAAFCHYYLGELAFNAGHLDRAQRHYEAVPDQVAPRQGPAEAPPAPRDVVQGVPLGDLHPVALAGHHLPAPVGTLQDLARPPAGQPGGRPLRRHDELRPLRPPGARHPLRGAGRGGLRGRDRGRERPGGRSRRQPDQGEEAHQHALVHERRARAAGAAAAPAATATSMPIAGVSGCSSMTRRRNASSARMMSSIV